METSGQPLKLWWSSSQLVIIRGSSHEVIRQSSGKCQCSGQAVAESLGSRWAVIRQFVWQCSAFCQEVVWWFIGRSGNPYLNLEDYLKSRGILSSNKILYTNMKILLANLVYLWGHCLVISLNSISFLPKNQSNLN